MHTIFLYIFTVTLMISRYICIYSSCSFYYICIVVFMFPPIQKGELPDLKHSKAAVRKATSRVAHKETNAETMSCTVKVWQVDSGNI